MPLCMLLCKEYLTLIKKNNRLLFSAVISQHFSKSRMIISVVAAKIWYLKNVRFLLGHPVYTDIRHAALHHDVFTLYLPLQIKIK